MDDFVTIVLPVGKEPACLFHTTDKLLCSYEAPPAVLCSALWLSEQEGHRFINTSLEADHEDNRRAGALLL